MFKSVGLFGGARGGARIRVELTRKDLPNIIFAGIIFTSIMLLAIHYKYYNVPFIWFIFSTMFLNERKTRPYSSPYLEYIIINKKTVMSLLVYIPIATVVLVGLSYLVSQVPRMYNELQQLAFQ